MIKLKSGVDSLDQQIGRLALCESVIQQWELKEKYGHSDAYFGETLAMFKINLEKNITFLESLKEAAE